MLEKYFNQITNDKMIKSQRYSFKQTTFESALSFLFDGVTIGIVWCLEINKFELW